MPEKRGGAEFAPAASTRAASLLQLASFGFNAVVSCLFGRLFYLPRMLNAISPFAFSLSAQSKKAFVGLHLFRSPRLLALTPW